MTLFYLPAYSQLSAIEPVWRDVKAHGMPWRTQTTLGDAYKAVEEALTQKAKRLQQKYNETHYETKK